MAPGNQRKGLAVVIVPLAKNRFLSILRIGLGMATAWV
jgi:hypothetical protein